MRRRICTLLPSFRRRPISALIALALDSASVIPFSSSSQRSTWLSASEMTSPFLRASAIGSVSFHLALRSLLLCSLYMYFWQTSCFDRIIHLFRNIFSCIDWLKKKTLSVIFVQILKPFLAERQPAPLYVFLHGLITLHRVDVFLLVRSIVSIPVLIFITQRYHLLFWYLQSS